MKKGDRVFVVDSASETEVKLIGFGVYEGDEVPPRPVGVMQAIFGVDTWEEVDRIVAEENIVPEEQRPLRRTNPKIVLDDGRVKWGAEVWFGPQDGYEKFRNGRPDGRAENAC